MKTSLWRYAALWVAAAGLAVSLFAAGALAPLFVRKARAEQRAIALQREVEKSRREAAAAAVARAAVDAELKRVEESIPAQRGDLELVDRLREVARRAGAVNVVIAPEGGLQIPSSRVEKMPPLLSRDPAALRTERVTFSAEGSYAAFIGFLQELARVPRFGSVENVSLTRRPPRAAWTITLKVGHW